MNKKSSPMAIDVILRLLIATIFIAAMLIPSSSRCEPKRGETLQGPLFYQPEENRNIVPAGWENQKVRYPPEFGNPDLLLTSDQHLYPVILPLIKAYAHSRGLNIVTREGTCGISAGMLARKQVDIGAFCCPPAPTDRLPGLLFHTVGITPNALIVHPDNPTSNISFTEAQQLFSGEITRWSELTDSGARSHNKPVHVVTRLHCKQRPGHWRQLLDNEDLFSPTLQNVASISDMINHVAADPDSIGFVARWKLDQTGNRNQVKPLLVNDISTEDNEALAAGHYPFYKVLNMTTWTGHAANERAQDLIHHLLGQQDMSKNSPDIVTADRLRNHDWRFYGNELIGEPVK